MLVDELTKILGDYGLKYRMMHLGEATIVVLERGARVIGVYPRPNSNNIVWTHPGLSDCCYSAREFVNGRYWNIGGDRTWFSPEVEYHVHDLQTPLDSYEVPSSVDPGDYELNVLPTGEVHLQQVLKVWANRSRALVDLKVSKTLRTVEDPIQISDRHTLSPYFYAGYETTVCASSLHSSTVPVSLWNIVQVPAPGEIIVATREGATVHTFFGPKSSKNVNTSTRSISLRLGAREKLKISIKAPYVAGRVAYIRHDTNGLSSLLVRNLNVYPEAHYGDVWATNLQDNGHCVQAYNDGGELGAFGELEYHSPLFNPPYGNGSVHDVSQVWCYQGPAEVIHQITRVLLSREF